MPTTTLTTAQLTLIKRTDVASAHLIIVARGRQYGRRFTVPEGRTVRHYIDDNHNLDVTVGTFGLALRGRLQPRETHTVGYRIMDYTLIPAEDDASRAASARHPEAQWHRHVDQSGKTPGAHPPLDAAGLGEGVPCDIVRLRRQLMGHRLPRKLPRLSQLLKDELLTQYTYIHCLFSRADQDGPTEVSQAPLLID